MAHELYCAGHLIQASVADTRTRGETGGLGEIANRFASMLVDGLPPEYVPGHPEIETALVELYRTNGDRRLARARRRPDRKARALLAPLARLRPLLLPGRCPLRRRDDDPGPRRAGAVPARGATDVYTETGREALLRPDPRPVARHGLEQDVSHRRDRLEACRRGLRRCLRAASGPRVLRDVCRDRVDHVELAAAAPHGRLEVRGADGAHALQRIPLRPRPRRDELLLRQPAPGARAVVPGGLVQLRLLPAEHHAPARKPRSLRGDADGRRCAGPPVRGRPDPRRAGRCRMRSSSSSRPATRSRAASRFASSRPRAARSSSPCACPAGRMGSACTVNGSSVGVEPDATGYLRLRREWSAGDEVVLELPLRPRAVGAAAEIDAARGCVAFERGPLVYCVEGIDLPATREPAVDLGGSVGARDGGAGPGHLGRHRRRPSSGGPGHGHRLLRRAGRIRSSEGRSWTARRPCRCVRRPTTHGAIAVTPRCASGFRETVLSR